VALDCHTRGQCSGLVNHRCHSHTLTGMALMCAYYIPKFALNGEPIPIAILAGLALIGLIKLYHWWIERRNAR
jgi:hypothetical protein